METMRKKLDKLRGQSARGEQVSMDASALLRFANGGIHFLLAAVLSGALLFGKCAPFGVALVGAAGSGICGAAALIGACFGYLVLMGFADGLRYVSASMLTFAVIFAFYDVKLLRKSWAMPLIASLLNGCTGFIYLSQAGWHTADVIYFLTECVLTGTACWCYRQLLIPLRAGRGEAVCSPQRRLSLVVLICTLLMSLASLHLFQDISLGRSLAVTAVLAAAWQGGCPAGAILGLSTGLSMDLTSGGMPLYAMAYGASGLAAGAFQKMTRLASALAYVLANGLSVLWTWEQGLSLSILYEVFLGSILFLFLPERPLRRLQVWFAAKQEAPSGIRNQTRARRHLEGASQSFRALSDAIRTSFLAPQNDNDIATVFDRAACKVCRTCALRSNCWERDYVSTYDSLNHAVQAMLDRGKGEAGDFPSHFSSRCLHFPAFLAAVNEELTALLYRRQYNSRIQVSRQAVWRQYGELSELLGAAAAELGQELTPDLAVGRKLGQRLSLIGGQLRGAALRDGRGLLRIEVDGPDCQNSVSGEEIAQLSQLLGVPLRVEEQERDHLSLVQQEPLMAVAGVAAQKKDGELVSGDAGSYFKRSDGTLYVLLCDGMGSGPQANRESTLALRLLEQFLQAGVDTEHALITLSSALALRGEEAGGFTTIDLLQVDLFTGDSTIFKLGAAPTYLKKGNSIRRISGSSLPAGLSMGGRNAPDRFPIRLSPGDCVLMVSDGVSGTGDDNWLRERFAQFTGDSPKDLAAQLITYSPQGATDDRTVLVVRVEKRI